MSERVPALDGLRGIAILLVLVVHTHVSPSSDWPSLLVYFAQSGGWMGVDLFFVLSGFLITGILVRSRSTPGYFRNFYARRALRIWPLYYLTLVFAFILAPHIQGFVAVGLPGNAPVWMLFLENVPIGLLNPPETAFDHLWSVAVEEQFYLVLPLLVVALSPRRLPWALAAAVGLAVAFRVALYVAGSAPFASYMLMPTRMDGFAIGGLLALGLASPMWRGRLAGAAIPVASLAGILLLAIGVTRYSFGNSDPGVWTWGYTVVAAFFGSLLVLAVTSPRVGRALSARWLRLFGKYSFAIYLLHYPIWRLILLNLWRQPVFGSMIPADLLSWALMATISLAIGWLCWNLIERHVLAFKRFFPAEHPAAATPSHMPATAHQPA